MRQMRNGPFLLFSLALFSAYACLSIWLRGELRFEDRTADAKIERFEKEAAEARLSAQLAQFELADWRQATAELIPSALRKKSPESEAYPLRAIASVASGDVESKLEIEGASTLFEKAKAEFRDKNFESADESFKVLLERYPSSRHVTEARFLLAEGAFRLKDFESAVDSIDILVDNFPESELTGFALLRLGEIYEQQDRREDASEIYRAVIKSYSNPAMLAQAKSALRVDER